MLDRGEGLKGVKTQIMKGETFFEWFSLLAMPKSWMEMLPN